MTADHARVMHAARKAGAHAARWRSQGGRVQAPDPLAGSLLARKAATAWHQGFAEAAGPAESKAMTGYDDLGSRPGMISLDIPPGVVEPVPGGVADSHVTIIFLGQDVGDGAFDEACSRAQQAAAAVPGPLTGTLSGIDSFPPSETGGKKPVFMPASIPGADRVRGDLEDLSASQFGFHPHVTLGYDDAGAPLPDPQPDKQVTFTHLSVHRGDEVRRFPFGGSSTASKGISGMLEVKVGPKGWSHGWVFHGVPGTGDKVHHPSHGKGVVTAATDKHVTVKFASGASRTFEHSKPALAERTGFVTRAEHESSQRAAGREAARAASEGPRHQRAFSAGYLRGEGATDSDVAELARRYQVMHGKPPTKDQLAKIKRAKPAAPGGSVPSGAAARSPVHRTSSDAIAHAGQVREADRAQGGTLPPLAVIRSHRQGDGTRVTHAVDHQGRDYTVTLGADKKVTVTRDGRSVTETAGPNPTRKARELAGRLTTPAPAAGGDSGGFWADQPGKPEPEPPKPAPKPKFEQGGMFAQPDKLGTGAMFGDRWGTSDITTPNPGAVAPAAGNGNASRAVAARAIAGDVRMERGLTKGQREEAEQRLYAAAAHLEAGNHGEALAELDAVRHRTGIAGGGVVKGSTAARAKELAAKIRAEHPESTPAAGSSASAKVLSGAAAYDHVAEPAGKQNRDAAYYYSVGSGRLNPALRNGTKLTDKTDRMQLRNLETAFTQAPPTAQSIVAYRGTTGALFGKGDAAGTQFTDHGFTSVSTDQRQAGMFGSESDPALMEIHIPAGSKVVKPGSAGQYSEGDDAEKELVLNHGGRYEITSDQVVDDPKLGRIRKLTATYLGAA